MSTALSFNVMFLRNMAYIYKEHTNTTRGQISLFLKKKKLFLLNGKRVPVPCQQHSMTKLYLG